MRPGGSTTGAGAGATRGPAVVPPWPPEDHVCAGCHLSYADLPATEAVRIVGSVPATARAVLVSAAPPLLSLRPPGGGWSITEYLCHLRDVYMTYTIRVYRGRFEDRPVLEPMLNELRARRFRYNERDPACVTDELGSAVAGFVDEAVRLPEDSLCRVVTRRPDEVRTVRWLLRQAAHEGLHHVRDVQRLARQEHGPARTDADEGEV